MKDKNFTLDLIKEKLITNEENIKEWPKLRSDLFLGKEKQSFTVPMESSKINVKRHRNKKKNPHSKLSSLSCKESWIYIYIFN